MGRQELKKLGPDSPPLLVVGDCKGHLGGVTSGCLPVVTSHRDHLALVHRDQSHPVDVIDVGEEGHLFGLEGLLDPEETEIAGLRAQSLEELDQQRTVLGLYGPDPGATTISEGNIQLELRRVIGHALSSR